MSGALPQPERHDGFDEAEDDEQAHALGKPRQWSENSDEPKDEDPHRNDGLGCE